MGYKFYDLISHVTPGTIEKTKAIVVTWQDVTTQLRRLLARSGLVDTRTWASDIRTSSVDFGDTIS